MAATTLVSFPTLGQDSPPMGGTLTESQVRTLFAAQVPGIGNMVGTSTTARDLEGNTTTTWTFTPRVGNKG